MTSCSTGSYADRAFPEPLERLRSHDAERPGAVRVPNPRTWAPEKVSQGYVADYKPFSVVDGDGVRCALFVSGCLFACPGCFNQNAWSFRFGNPYDDALEDRIVSDLAQPYVQGLTLLGGEPMLNTPVCLRLVERVRTELPSKDIWAWTGFTFEWIQEHGTASQRALLRQVDVLIDGPFRQELKDLTLGLRGSTNQRVLDVPPSLESGRAVWFDGRS